MNEILSLIPQDEFILRRLLAVRYSGASLYTDDGELLDSYEVPYIDFLRDAPKDIEMKIYERHQRALARVKDLPAQAAENETGE